MLAAAFLAGVSLLRFLALALHGTKPTAAELAKKVATTKIAVVGKVPADIHKLRLHFPEIPASFNNDPVEGRFEFKVEFETRRRPTKFVLQAVDQGRVTQESGAVILQDKKEVYDLGPVDLTPLESKTSTRPSKAATR